MLSQEQTDLASRTNYFCNSRFISGNIMEYDLRAANISMLRDQNLITDDYYSYLLHVDKGYREKIIGLQIRNEMESSGQKDPLIGSPTYKAIHDGIINAKLQLFDSNNIQLNEVIRIANDAVYVNRLTPLEVTKFGEYIEFKKKMTAETAIKLGQVVIFYYTNYNGLNIEIKGIGDGKDILHQDYFLSFIGSVLLTYERAGTIDAIHLIEDFYKDYVDRNLPKEFYRELNSRSLYRIKNSGYFLEDINDMNLIDISYNGNIIRELWTILLSKYK